MAYLTGEPRIDVREIDLSQLITSSSSNVGVVVGQAERGPVMKRVFVTDDSDYKSIFGSTDTSKYGLMAPTALTFLEGSNQLYVTRVVGDGAAFAGIAVAPSIETTVEETVLITESSVEYPVNYVLTHSPVDYSSLKLYVNNEEVATLDNNGNLVMKEGQTSTITGRYVYSNNTLTILSTTFGANTQITARYVYYVNNTTSTTEYVNTEDTLFTVSDSVVYPLSVELSQQASGLSSISICAGATAAGATQVATLNDSGAITMDDGQTSAIVGSYSLDTNTFTIESTTFTDDTVIVAKYTYAVVHVLDVPTTGFTTGEMTTENYDISDNYPDDVIAIYSDNQGSWGNNLKVSVSNIDTRDATFDITVFETVNNIDISREVYHVSRVEQLDGNGNQLYLEDAINGNSLYIRVRDLKKDNPDLLPSTFTKVKLTGAVEGAAPTQSQLAAAYDLYEDYEAIDVDLIMDSGYVSKDDITVQNKIRTLCESRQDCVGILSVPANETSMSPSTDCTDWRLNLQGIDSSYVGLYTPWIQARDTFKNKIIKISPVGYVGAIMASLDDTYYAPAGLNNGVMKSTLYPVTGLSEEYKFGHRSALYDSGINVIKPYPGIGYVVWGQKTEQTMASATDRFNVRRSLNTIKRAIRKAYMYKLFKVNDEWTRSSLYNAVVAYLNTRRAAFYDFKVICDESNNTPEVIDRNHIVLTVMIKPVKSAEYGILNVVITSTGVEFSSVEGSISI